MKGLLEEFSSKPTASKSDARKAEPKPDLDAVRAEGFEAGYSVGWEDANKASQDSHAQVTAEFERNIKDLGFSYHEAIAHMRAELADIFQQFVASFLEPILPDMTILRIREHLTEATASTMELPVEIVVSPDARERIEPLLAVETSFPVRLVVEDTLAADQVFVRLGKSETMIDFEPVLTEIRTQISAVKIQSEGDKDVG